MRTFDDIKAVRAATPLLIGLTGASSSGKTFSALRLATGIARVVGGPIFYLDSEARRSLHYADKFDFRFVEFKAPFGPMDYLAAIEHCAAKGAKTIVIDSMSHEHEGPGGVLEMHEAEAQRLAAAWKTSLDKVKMSAWQKPKSERKRLINSILQMPINFIFCFRAKEKIDLSGDKPRGMGWCPVAGEEFVYEQTVNFLLYPGSDGVPTWKTNETGERAMIKLPGQFRDIFATPHALSEDDGEKMARWAAGSLTAEKPRGPKATAEQVDEIGGEFKRLGWMPQQCTDWLRSEFGVTKRVELTEAQGTAAAVKLIHLQP